MTLIDSTFDTTEPILHIVAYENNSDKIGFQCELSPAVLLFAQEMQVKLDLVDELQAALIDSHHENTVQEAADIANFAMFIALNSTRVHNG